ncbi:MAG: hydrogenase expression/formation protein HypE [Bacteroidota bacterium]
MALKTDCPLPTLDFDVITLGHGSGGLLTHKLLETGVFDLLKNEHLDAQHDGAFLELEGKTAFSTDSFVISPIIFPGGNIGELAVNGTVNDLAMCGAVPQYLSLGFIIEEGLTMAEFWEVLVGVKYAAERAGVQVVTGDTKVVERGKGDKLFINTTGIGKVHAKANIAVNRIKEGDKIIVSGELATHGIAIMSVREGLEFETDIRSDTQNLNHVVIDLIERFGDDIHVLRDPTRGGVATVLKEMATQSALGMTLDHNSIPVNDGVEGACEMLGLDPLYVANEGLFIAVVDASREAEFLAKLRETEEGSNAACIGTVTSQHPGQVLMTSAIGGRRVLNMLPGEQLPRIC